MNDITIPEFEELRFDEARHIYILNGLEIPSVTTVMKPLSNAEYKGISESVLNRAAEKGTAVHNAAENWVKFQIDDIDPEYRGYFDAFLAWWDEKKPVAVGSEVRLYHKIMRYAGTADLIAWVDGELTLIDYKTTSKLIEMNCGVQLEAYAKALASHGIDVQGKRILHLKKDGKYAEMKFPSQDSRRWTVFGALKTVYDYIESSK
jgi:hypothetical protein